MKLRRTTTRRARAARRRGVAILLVIVAVATATVLSSAFLMSRQSAPAIGMNSETSSNAKWAAHSSANLAVAILQTSLDPQDDIDVDNVIAEATFGIADSRTYVTDSDGEPISSADHRVLLTSIGAAGSIGSVDQRVLVRRPTNKISEALDPYMREFAVFAVNRLRLQTGSYVAPWPDSERGPSLFTANIGVAFGPSSQLSTSGAGSLTSAVLVVDDDATSSLTTLARSSTFAGGIDSGVQFPTASARVPEDLVDLGSSLTPLYIWNPGSTSYANDEVYGDVRVTAGATLVFDESRNEEFSVRELVADLGSRILIRGNVRILVRDDLEITDRSAIELADDASSVEFYVYDDLLVTNAVIGLPQSLGANTSRSFANLTGDFDASKIRIFLVDQAGGGDPTQFVTINSRGALVADVHAPAATVVLDNNSFVIGRIAGADVRLSNSSAIFYDHKLNPGAGLANPLGPMYDASRYSTLRSAFASFDNDLGLDSFVKHIIDEFDEAGVDPDPDEPGPLSASAPDPRDGTKVVAVPLRRAGARSIEAGDASDVSLVGAVAVGAGSSLGRTISDVASDLRRGVSALAREIDP